LPGKAIANSKTTGNPVVCSIAGTLLRGQIWRAMKSVKRFCFGIISSALFAVGLARAADRFDPVMLGQAPSNIVLKATSDCTTEDCWIDSTIAG
jgi:hypothetical protein